MRFNLALAIVAMVHHGPHKAEVESWNSTVEMKEGACGELLAVTPLSNYSAVVLVKREVGAGEFVWTEAEQGFILGSFFWGYVASGIPGGLLSQRFGGKWVVSSGLLVAAILTLAIPISARMGKEYLVILQSKY
jgi:MFS family permease